MIVVGTGMLDETGWTKVCCCTVMRPFELAANEFIWSVTHWVAAPMPRFGSVWLEAVCRVPNETSFVIVAWIRSGSICRRRSRRAGSAADLGSLAPVAACAEPEMRGTVAAATADADRNTRRVVPARAGTALFSMP